MNTKFSTILLITNVLVQAHGAKISSEIAEGLCKQYAQFMSTKNFPSRLERHQNPPVLRQAWLIWKSCGEGSCKPFTIDKRNILITAEPRLRKNTRILPERSVIVEMRGEPDCLGHELSTLYPIPCDNGTGNARILTKFLKNYAATAQAKVMQIFESKKRSFGIGVEPLWITNKIIVTGSDVATVKQMLDGHPDVKTVRLEAVEEIIRPLRLKKSSRDPSPPYPDPKYFWGQIELNISAIHAAGVNGSGIVVGGIDSGVDYTHPALFSNFRGEYGWFDPYFGDPFPNDPQEHGTHTMGTIAGQQPFGVAPGATWMACRSCYQNGCFEGAVIRCLQWMLCPTRPNGTDPDCSKKPRVVNSSWGAPHLLPSGKPEVSYEGIFRCWRQAGIIPVFSAGNRGPGCSTLSYPGTSNQVMAVGMLSGQDEPLHVFPNSSRGPSHPYWNGTIKPDFTAPGDDILSTYPDGEVGTETGTSQAAPHVTGTIALMLQVNPSLGFHEIRSALIDSCRPLPLVYPQTCGGISENGYPNNQAGYGSINSFKAVFGRWP